MLLYLGVLEGDIYRNILCETLSQHAGFSAIKIKVKLI